MLRVGAKNRLFLEIAQVWVAVTFANLLLFAFHILVGRGLGPQDYSLFGALIGVVFIFGALANAVRVAVAKLVATSAAADDGPATSQIVGSSLLQMAVLGTVIFLVLLLASPLLRTYLHSPSMKPIIATASVIAVSVLMPVTWGALQGRQRFTWFSLMQVVNAGTRLALGWGCLTLKLGTTGVVSAIGVSGLITAGFGLALLRPSLAAPFRALPGRSIASLLGPTLIGSIVVSFPTSVDVIIVRHFFSADEAGLYTGASVLGRIVLFAPVAVILVLFPKMAAEWERGGSAYHLLYMGLALTALLSGVLSLGFAILPDFALSLFLGSEYRGAENLVAPYAAAMLLFSLAIVFLQYWLATGQLRYVYAVVVPHMVLNVGLMYVFHESTEQIVLVMLSVSASLVILSFVAVRTASVRIGRGGRILDQSPTGYVRTAGRPGGG